ncbi:MAG: glycosyltransferase family 4 protein [Brevinematia bacterium]
MDTKNRKRFVTILKFAVNVDLVKMTGQIPYKMYKNYGYSSTLVTYRNESEEDLDEYQKKWFLQVEKFTYHKDVVKGLKLFFLKRRGILFGLDRAIIEYLLKYSKKIDVLHLFHYSLQSMLYVIIYKMLNPNGIAYITLDNDLGSLKEFPKSLLLKHPTNFIRNIIAYNVIEPLFLKKVDLLSTETIYGEKVLKDLYKDYAHKFYYQPYGIDEYFINQSGIKVKNFEEKENIIMTAAKVGIPQKNHEMLLQALSKVNLRDFKVIIAGRMLNPEFEKFLEEYFEKYPKLREKIIFTGHISDRNKLYDLYNRSKIFVMTSNFESFGIVMAEAGYFGNYLITTDVTSAKDLTNNEECGDIVPIGDVDKFAEKLQYAIDHPEYVRDKAEKMKQHVRQNFVWDKIVERLYNKICELEEKKSNLKY